MCTLQGGFEGPTVIHWDKCPKVGKKGKRTFLRQGTGGGGGGWGGGGLGGGGWGVGGGGMRNCSVKKTGTSSMGGGVPPTQNIHDKI